MPKNKKTFSKKRMIVLLSLRAALLLFIGFIVSVVIVASQIDPENFRDDIADGLTSAIGVPVEIKGGMTWRMSIRPTASLSDIRILNADWAENRYGVRIDSVVVVLDPIALLTRRAAVRNLSLINTKIIREENDKGEMSISPSFANGYALPRAYNNNGNGVRTYPQFPFVVDFGVEVIEVVNFSFTQITPEYSENWTIDRFYFRNRNFSDRIEFDGAVVHDGIEHRFAARFSELDEYRRVYPVRIAIAGRGGSPLVINAALERNSRIPIDFKINGTVSDLRRFGQILNLDLPDIPRFNINMHGGMGHSEVTVHRATLTSGNNDLRISGNANWHTRRTPHITANVISNNINLRQVIPDLYAPSNVQWTRPDYRDLHAFRYIPLPASLLRAFNADITLDMDNLVVYRELAVRDIDATIRLYNGNLTARAHVEMGGGDVDAKVIGFERDGQIFARAAGRGRDIVVGEILRELRTHNFLTGLPSAFDVYLESNGSDLTELMSNLNGQVRGWSTGRGRALRDLTDYLYGRDLLTTVRANVENVVRRGNTDVTHINCAAVNLKIRNGRAETERGIAVETTDVNIRATGYVDLGRERMRVSAAVTPVTGLRMSVSGNMINSFEIRGNLSEPEIQINRGAVAGRAVAATGLGIALAPLTGGLSLAAGAGIGLLTTDILGNWLADDNPCRTALSADAAPLRRNDLEILRRPLAELVDEMID